MLQAGITLERRYEIEEVLGQGGMGCVYRVRHLALKRTLALKELTVTASAAEAQFLSEARILASVDHPHMPRVSDYFSVGARHYLVMEFVAGDDLQTLLDRRGRPFEEMDILPWLEQLLDALQYLHARGITHRDIKPANLKLTPEGKLVLVDFGIAKISDGASPGPTGFYARQAYTPYLTAPEQITGQGTGPRTDLYAVGATFVFLLTGQLPPSGAGLRSPLGTVLTKAMAPDPGGRWSDARAMRLAMEAIGLPHDHARASVVPTGRDIRRR